MRATKKKLISYLLYYQNSFYGAGGGLMLVIIAFLTFQFVSPIFIPKIPYQPIIKEITAIIPEKGVDNAVLSLASSGIRRIFALSYDNTVSGHSQFAGFRKISDSDRKNIMSMINTSYVLIHGASRFAIPSNIPNYPNKPMVIGYTFSRCYEKGFALLLPDRIEGSLITKEAYQRFIEFSQTKLTSDYTEDEAFRIFSDFHSLHLFMLPCSKPIKNLPSWESIEVIESDEIYTNKPWDNLPRIPEVWRVAE